MKEYIKREDAIQAAKHAWAKGLEPSQYIECLPAAEVAEVRHGRWEKFSTASGIISRVRCSVCAGTQPLTFESMPYCPACGARMDKEDEHEAGRCRQTALP